ncbi:MAG: hypothetical protein QMD46_03555 [Methanomicrobiales archaeon]|nr:hypothetical protein [Methanomicrobiales archaeon]MDI6875995.1 hypothetical protein [Methanomicrobiales archaeon]
MERQERIALLLLVGVTAAILLSQGVLTLIGKSAFASPLTNASREGELVVLEGTVDRVTHTREGGHLILSVNGMPVFVPSPVSAAVQVEPGSRVTVYGVVQTYRGEREIVVQSAGDVIVEDP